MSHLAIRVNLEQRQREYQHLSAFCHRYSVNPPCIDAGCFFRTLAVLSSDGSGILSFLPIALFAKVKVSSCSMVTVHREYLKIGLMSWLANLSAR